MKCFLFGVLLVVCHVFYAQEHKTTTLYRYGKPLVTCETNFENLFSNVPKYIENNDDLDLLSYQFIGVAKNVNHVKKLLKKNFSLSSMGCCRNLSGLCYFWERKKICR